jgi:Zn-dependent alcohol dehydrogenase
MVSEQLPLSEINTAFEQMETGAIARDVIMF